MKTEQALDLAYENPFTCITTESLYEYGEHYFYYDSNENLKNEEGNIITEDKIYKLLPEAEDEEFDEWIEIDVEVPEKEIYEDSYESFDDE